MRSCRKERKRVEKGKYEIKLAGERERKQEKFEFSLKVLFIFLTVN